MSLEEASERALEAPMVVNNRKEMFSGVGFLEGNIQKKLDIAVFFFGTDQNLTLALAIFTLTIS
jgi:hypothetical protein